MPHDERRLLVIGYQIPGPDIAEIVMVSVRSSSEMIARPADPPVIVRGDGQNLDRAHMQEVFERTMTEEFKPVLPEPLRETFTVADSLIDVTSARSDREATNRLAGTCTGVVVSAMFHAAGLGAVAPIVRAIDSMLDRPEPSTSRDRTPPDPPSREQHEPAPDTPSSAQTLPPPRQARSREHPTPSREDPPYRPKPQAPRSGRGGRDRF